MARTEVRCGQLGLKSWRFRLFSQIDHRQTITLQPFDLQRPAVPVWKDINLFRNILQDYRISKILDRFCQVTAKGDQNFLPQLYELDYRTIKLSYKSFYGRILLTPFVLQILLQFTVYQRCESERKKFQAIFTKYQSFCFAQGSK